MEGERKKLKPETARRLSLALDGIDSAKANLTAARDAGPEALVAAADRYLAARDEMGATMGAIGEELGES